MQSEPHNHRSSTNPKSTNDSAREIFLRIQLYLRRPDLIKSDHHHHHQSWSWTWSVPHHPGYCTGSLFLNNATWHLEPISLATFSREKCMQNVLQFYRPPMPSDIQVIVCGETTSKDKRSSSFFAITKLHKILLPPYTKSPTR